jgi:hypothetical protein
LPTIPLHPIPGEFVPEIFITKSLGAACRHSFPPARRQQTETAMSFLSSKTFAIVLAAAALGVTSLASFEASAWPLKPGVSPMPGTLGKPSGGCPGGMVGCTPNTYTPGNSGGGNWHSGNWHGGGYGGIGLSINVAQPVSDGDCYYVRRRIMTDIGVITKRQLVCE